MQERVVLDRAPVPPVENAVADEVERARDMASVAPRHDEQYALRHALADQAEEFAREIGAAPFAAARVHVEGEEGVPVILGDAASRHPFHGDAVFQRALALLADHLALARGQIGQKIFERGITAIVPVELLIRALKESMPAEPCPLAFRQKGDMERGYAAAPRNLDRAVHEAVFRRLARGAGRSEQARAGCWRERHRNLKLRIVASARALQRVGPSVI